MTSSWENLKVDESNMPLYTSLPESGGPVPGVVVVHGQSGLESFIKDTTHMLALQGLRRGCSEPLPPRRSGL